MGSFVQLLVLVSLGLFAIAAILLVADLVRLACRRPIRPRMAMLLGFCAGALLVGWVAWQTLKPSRWALSFWTTLQAGVDSETYGHVVEHAAEVLATNVVILAAIGGLVAGGLLRLSLRVKRH